MNEPVRSGGLEQRVLAGPGPGRRLYGLLLTISILMLLLGVVCWVWQIQAGLVVTGLNRPVGWGIYFTDFVFWMGLAQSGALTSAVLYLLRARFGTSVRRLAEAMTVAGVLTAGFFPVIQLGRPWLAYWLLPYPNRRRLWVNFQSPLLWDVLAVLIYFVVSVGFLLVSIVPDAASLRGQVTGWRRRLFGSLALGWQGSGDDWRHHSQAYLYLAALCVPLVSFVSSGVAWDFAVSVVPGWHSTIVPVYFLAGALSSASATILVLSCLLRRVLGIEDLLASPNLERLAQLVLLSSLTVTYCRVIEVVMALRAGPGPGWAVLAARMGGEYAPWFWMTILCNSIAPLSLFWARIRSWPMMLVAVGLSTIVGMWLERFVMIVTSLSREYLPFSWRTCRPSFIELGITIGSLGWFLTWFLLFLGTMPALSLAGMKQGLALEANRGA